ncbi:serine protease, partial [Escherichia coli]|nr:serine protease [Escherichia coli]
PVTTDACSPLTNAAQVAGNIALIDRGDCTFVTKVANAQVAGAVGVIIANNAGEGLITMTGAGPGLSIPAVSVGQSLGAGISS